MPRRVLSETGYYHIATRSAGKIALFEDDDDRRSYLRLLKEARDKTATRVIAWVLMTDHVHLILDTGETPELVSIFMNMLDGRYTRYFNAKTGRTGTLFQGRYWSRPIVNDSQLVATVHYVHMNPEAADMCPMRSYRWSSYQEYLGKKWVVDTSVVLGLFGSFKAFDAYQGSPKDVVRKRFRNNRDGLILARAMEIAGVQTSEELRSLSTDRRNEVIFCLSREGATTRQIARAVGIGHATVTRILRSQPA